MIDARLQDLRDAWRSLRKGPAFTALAVVSLAVAIGLNAALVGLVDALLFRPVPARAPDELVSVYTSGSDGDAFATSSYLDYVDLAAENDVFSGLAGHSLMFTALNAADRSRLIAGEIVTGNFFEVLGIPALLGRTFTWDDDRAGANRVVMLSYRHWQRELRGDPAVIGRTLRLKGLVYTIVGVVPEWFTGLMPALSAELWLPVSVVEDVEPAGIIDTVPSPTGASRLDRRGQRWLFVKGRLRPGASIEQARANVELIGRRLQATHVQTNKDRRLSVLPASQGRLLHPSADQLVATIGLGLMALLGLVLLIACFNVAGLLLARSTSRRREIGVRVAIGATRGRIVSQFLVEAGLLAAVGAAAGAAFAALLVRFIESVPLPLPIAVSVDVPFSSRILVFTIAAGSVAGLVTGLVPALRAGRMDLIEDLRNELAAERRWSGRDALVLGQMAATLVLLIVAGLLGRSLVAASSAPVGFATDGLAIVSTDPAMAGYDAAGARQFYERALQHLEGLPGLSSVALASRLPFSLNFTANQYDVPGHTSPENRGFTVLSATVSSDYFRTLGIPLLEGRSVAPADAASSPRVAVISETMARRFWQGRSAIGQRFRRTDRDVWIEVIGVAADYRVRTIGEEPQAYIHFPVTQSNDVGPIFVARTPGDAASAVAALRRELLALEPNLVLMESQTMQTQVGATLLPMRFSLAVAGVAGLVALACIIREGADFGHGGE